MTHLLLTGTLAVLAVGWLSAPGGDATLGPAVAAADPAADGAGHPTDGAGHAVDAAGPVLAAATDPTDTSWGLLTATDRDLLVRVRQAGLWEMPTGDMARTHASGARVKEVGRLISADHHRLDEQVVALARRLQVPLPDQANPDQRGWVAELTGLRGADFDAAFANRLRVAHGRVFAVVSEVRASTRNTAVRAFAGVAVDVVMRHMSLLESTGLVAPVEADTLAPPAPRGPITTPLVVTVVALAAVANLAIAARRSWS